MTISSIQDILNTVEKPSRYLGTEVNRVLKDPSKVSLHMVLAFPDMYEIGTSHFGIQILYHLINEHSKISAERVFAPAKDMEQQLRRNHDPLCSLESKTPLSQFDIIGFSLLYELNYTNVLNMIDLAGLPLRARERSTAHPLIIAGGPCVCNPEPMADFFDAMVFGDGESVVLQMAQMWIEWKNKEDKTGLLRQWARLEGVYIPSFFTPTYDPSGFQRLEPTVDGYHSITRAIVADLDQAPFPDKPIVPFARPIHDRLRLEISRGCTRGCRFCQAGMIYRPIRERSPDKLLELARNSLAATGFEDISLLSLSTGDYTCLSMLIENLILHGQRERVAVSLPSIRAGTLDLKLMEMIKKVRKTGFTIAPEAGSQRLRNVINKNISFEDVAGTVQDAFAMGWHVIKLYFMIGLPTETEEDIDAIGDMVEELKQIKGPAKRRGQINVSVTPFVPKPHTPFQWASQLSMTEVQAKLERLKKRMRNVGVQLKGQHPAMSLLEGVFARGDRRLADVLIRAWQGGCTFDGWSDQFNFTTWQSAFEACGMDFDFFTTRQRSLEEPLPWAHMESRVSLSFLSDQWKAAQNSELLSDCRHGQCHQCGVCDFSTVKPMVLTHCAIPGDDSPQPQEPENFIQWELTYSKLGVARFFGHLEMANIFARALRRSGIGVKYSQGFHPMPHISFDDPLPLGMESEAEKIRITADAGVIRQTLVERLDPQLPAGIRIIACHPVGKGLPKPIVHGDAYQVTLNSREVNDVQLEAFNQANQWPYIRSQHKGRSRSLDLKASVSAIEKVDCRTLSLFINRIGTLTVRPADVLMGIFGMSKHELSEVRVIKMAPRFEQITSKERS